MRKNIFQIKLQIVQLAILVGGHFILWPSWYVGRYEFGRFDQTPLTSQISRTSIYIYYHCMSATYRVTKDSKYVFEIIQPLKFGRIAASAGYQRGMKTKQEENVDEVSGRFELS